VDKVVSERFAEQVSEMRMLSPEEFNKKLKFYCVSFGKEMSLDPYELTQQDYMQINQLKTDLGIPNASEEELLVNAWGKVPIAEGAKRIRQHKVKYVQQKGTQNDINKKQTAPSSMKTPVGHGYFRFEEISI